MISLLMIIAALFVSSAHSFDERMDPGQELVEKTILPARATADASWCGTRVEKTLGLGGSHLFGSPGYPARNYPTHATCMHSFKTVAGAKLRLSCANLTLEWFSTFSFTDGSVTKKLGCHHCRGDVSFTHDFAATSAEVRFSSCSLDGPAFQCKMEAIEKCKCGRTLPLKNSERIVGGTEVSPNKYGWVVDLQVTPSNAHFCGGTLISANWVVTASHCMKHISMNNLTMRLVLGSHNRSETSPYKIFRDVKKVIIHPDFKTRASDYALIQIEPVDLATNPKISTICLPQPSQSYVDKMATVAGWGRLVYGSKEEFSPVLNELKTKVMSIEQCQRWVGPKEIVTINADRELCAGGVTGQTGACQGDSGGPLMLQRTSGAWELIGVASWAWKGCVQKGKPQGYAAVSNQVDWIKNNTEGYETCV